MTDRQALEEIAGYVVWLKEKTYVPSEATRALTGIVNTLRGHGVKAESKEPPANPTEALDLATVRR